MLRDFELQEHELTLLREATRTVDALDALAAVVAKDGAVVVERGRTRVHPALVEARQLKIALARLLAALRLPTGDEDDVSAAASRVQRRVGVRGVYALPGGAG